MKLPDLRGEKYEYTPEQKALELQYKYIVELLCKAGFPAVYQRLWTWEPGTQPGFITLEEGTTPKNAL